MDTQHGWSRFARLALLLPFALGVCTGAWADENDPPARVARLAYEEGAVSLQPGGVDDWVAAPVNRPLTTGDKLWSDRDSRAELQLDGSLLHLSSQTAIAVLDLDDRITQIQLTAGTLIVHVRRLDDDETYEIDTPNLAFSILRPGVYRLSVDESGTATTIGVRRGQGEVTGGGSAYPVRANEQDVFTGTNELGRERRALRAGRHRVRCLELRTATIAGSIPRRHATCRPISWATRTWMIGAHGTPRPSTGMSGFPAASRPAGPPTTRGTGPTLRPGATPGLTISPGGLRRFITDAGCR